MLENLESGIGLDIVLWLQENRTAWMEVLSEILSELGADFGYIAIFGLIYWIINKRQGLRLIFALVIIAIVTFALKDALMRPRPFQAFPELVMPVFEADGYGLPSGHTSFAVMIWGYIALWIRKGWMWAFAIFYMGLQATARMVAGVHFPQDIALGILVGLLTLIAYLRVLEPWSTVWNKQSASGQLGIAIVIPVLLSIILIALSLAPEQVEAYLTLLGLALGAGIGAVVEKHLVNFRPHPDDARKAGGFVLGIVLTILVVIGLTPLFDLIAETGLVAYSLRLVRYGVAGFTAVAIVPYLGVRLSLMQTTSPKKMFNIS